MNGFAQPSASVFAESSSASNTPLFFIGADNAGSSASADVIPTDRRPVTSINHRKTTRAVFDGTWHHLVWVDENGQAKVFVDGVLDETSFAYTRGTLTLDTTAIGAIARATTGNFFAGAIDDIAVWNRALSWTEIEQIQAAAVPPPTADGCPADPRATCRSDQLLLCALQLRSGGQRHRTAELSNGDMMDWIFRPQAIPPRLIPSLTLGGLLPPAAAGGYSILIANIAGAVNQPRWPN